MNRRSITTLALAILTVYMLIDFRLRVQEARVDRILQRVTRDLDASTARAIAELQRAAWNTPPPIWLPGGE